MLSCCFRDNRKPAKRNFFRQSGRSPIPEPSPNLGRSPSFKDREEAKSGGSGQEQGGQASVGQGDAAGGLGALRDLGEQLVAEQEAEEVERALLKPIGEGARWEKLKKMCHLMKMCCQCICRESGVPAVCNLVTRSESTMSCRTLDADESITSCQVLKQILKLSKPPKPPKLSKPLTRL